MASYIVVTGKDQSGELESARSTMIYIMDRMLWFGYQRHEIRIVRNKVKMSMMGLIWNARDGGEDYDS